MTNPYAPPDSNVGLAPKRRSRWSASFAAFLGALVPPAAFIALFIEIAPPGVQVNLWSPASLVAVMVAALIALGVRFFLRVGIIGAFVIGVLATALVLLAALVAVASTLRGY